MTPDLPPVSPAGPPPLPVAAQTPWRIWHFVVVWLGGLAGSLMGLPFTSISLTEGSEAALELTGTDALAVLLPAQLIGNILAVAVLILMLKLSFEKSLGFEVRPRDGWLILVGVALSFLVSLAVTPLADALGAAEDIQGLGALMESLAPGLALFVAFLAIVVVTPMVEEVLFRGILQRAIGRRLSSVPTILSTAAVFALAHVAAVPAEDFVANATITFVSIFLVGLVLSWLVERDGRLGRAIGLHTGFNLVSFVVLYGVSSIG